MVVVHVRDDYVPHRSRVDAEELQAVARRTQPRAAALRGDCGGEAGIDHERAFRIPHEPHEIVHRHGRVVRIPAEEMIGAARVAHRVLDGVDLVFGQHERSLQGYAAIGFPVVSRWWSA